MKVRIPILIMLFCLHMPLIGADRKPLTKKESAKVIENAIREAVRKPKGRLTEEDYGKIVELKLFNQEITDISLLSRLTRLEKSNNSSLPPSTRSSRAIHQTR